MIPQLSALEARVVGCLLEKQITTPDQYPLSLNALVLACNQKSNRDPVLELTDRDVQELLDALLRRHLVLEKSGFGSRVAKYQQRFCNTEFSALQFSAQERAILCELLLRGPQTPGELRTRASRMAEFSDSTQIESSLEQLAQREGGACVVRLPRDPGKREARYAHLFSGEPQPVAAAPPAAPGSAAAPAHSGDARAADAGAIDAGLADPRLAERVMALEQQVAALRAELQSLRVLLPPGTG